MEQYISKSALIAEIEKQRSAYISEPSKYKVLSRILSLINTLEVKEVNLEKELDSMITPELKFHKALPSLFDVAKHFFELGLKAQRKSISIQNVDDILKESGVDPDSKVAKMFKESYYAAIDKLLEQKRK